MLSCTQTLTNEVLETNFGKALKKHCGTDVAKMNTIFADMATAKGFKPEFVNWCIATKKATSDLSFVACNPDNIIDLYKQWKNATRPNGNDTISNKRKDRSRGYVSDSHRKFCVSNVGLSINLNYVHHRFVVNDVEDKDKEYFYNEAKNRYRDELVNRALAAAHIDMDAFNDRLDQDRLDNIIDYLTENTDFSDAKIEQIAIDKEVVYTCKELLKNSDNESDKNLIALVEEMLDYTTDEDGNLHRDNFFKEVVSKNNLYKILNDVDDFKEEATAVDSTSEDIADGVDVENSYVPLTFGLDNTIAIYNQHDGELANFMLHVDQSIQTYFNSLPVLASTYVVNGVYDVSRNNPLGMATNMTARQVTSMLYAKAKRNGDINDFIESIRDIAETTPGYEGLIVLYNDIKGYTKSTTSLTGEIEETIHHPNWALAEQLYNIFSKPIISKQEIIIDKEGNRKTRISNYSASPKDSLRMQFINDVESSATSLVHSLAFKDYTALQETFDTISKSLTDGVIFVDGVRVDYNSSSDVYNADKNALLEGIYKQLSLYYPAVTLYGITKFVNNATTNNQSTGAAEVNEIANISFLLNQLNTTIQASQQTKANYDDKLNRAAIAQKNGTKEVMDEYGNIKRVVDADVAAAIDDIYAKSHLSDANRSAAIILADALLPYTATNPTLSSRNAAGNMSSDVLNSNMLSYLKRLIQHEDNRPGNRQSPLHALAKDLFQNNQFDFSNILVEHKDSKGELINRGLFRRIVKTNPITKRTTIEYEPTEYATELLDVTLFTGTSDQVNKDSALYTGMSRGDYLISALTAYFSPVSSIQDSQIKFSNFFLKTPSDAPKNFLLKLPSYSAEGLFALNEDEINNDIAERLRRIPVSNVQEGTSKSKAVSEEDFIKIVTGEKVGRIWVKPGFYNTANNETREVFMRVSHNGNVAVINGIINKTETGAYINNISLRYVYTDKETPFTESFTNTLVNYYRNELVNNNKPLLNGKTVTRTINRNHPIYKQFHNIIKQEITNAGVALTTLFKKQISIDDLTGKEATTFIIDGNVVWNDYFANQPNPDAATEEHYHRTKGKKVVEKNKNGVCVLTGKAFTSDRFTLFSELEYERDNKLGNYFNDLFADGKADHEDGRIHLLYGGYNTHLHINPDNSITLTAAQEEYIQARLDKFVIDYTKAAFEQIRSYDNLIDENTPSSYQDISEFILNYRLALIGTSDILEGDSKSYKDFSTFFKRAKEGQGGGVPYSLTNFTRTPNDKNRVQIFSSLNENKDIKALVDSGLLHDCFSYNVFRGVTVKNTVRTSADSKNLVEDLTSVILHTQDEYGIPFSEDKAKEMAKSMMAGYADTTVNDAQSYITFEEWIRRISARGQLPKYMHLIKKLTNENEPITVNDIKAFIQVQKNFYFDQYYDDKTNHRRARQIKNAEFVLVPRLIRGTDLEKVYNTMINHGIDQLNTEETSKAGKRAVLTLWDNDGHLSDEWFNANPETIQDAVEYYDYNFLYTQQETPQHMNAENKAAIQLMKKIVDNIPQYLGKNEHPLWKFKQRFYQLYSTKIKNSNATLLERLGVAVDDNGKFKINDTDGIVGYDPRVLSDMLQEEVLRQGRDAQLLDFVTLNTTPVEDSGTASFGLDTVMPIYANNAMRLTFEFTAQALFNHNVTRQTLPGFHAAQVTGVGWLASSDNTKTYKLLKHYAKDKNLKLPDIITKEAWKKLDKKDRFKYAPVDGVGLDSDLKYHPAKYVNKADANDVITEREYLELSDAEKKKYNRSGKATVIEVRVPKSAFSFNYKKPNGDYKTDDELLDEIRTAGLDEFIGYRIPTEGKQSMAVMKVVGFVEDAYGSTIIVPDDWVSQTGSDFDIDSVYTCLPHNRANSFTGKIEKNRFKTTFDFGSYINYIERKSDNIVSKRNELAKKKEELRKNILAAKQDDFNNLQERESEVYDQLDDNAKKAVKRASDIKKAGLTKQQILIKRCENIVMDLNTYLNENELSQDKQDIINEFIEINKQILQQVQTDKYTKEINEGSSRINKEYAKELEKQAVELGLPSYEEYQQLSNEERNSGKAIDNELLQQMLNILKSDFSLEENLSRSNFLALKDARDALFKLTKSAAANEKAARSPYDFLAQASNQEDAISGRELKGISVASDNMISICNTVRPLLSADCSIKIYYSADEFDFDTLSARFNEGDKVRVKLVDNGKLIEVTHKQYGWSNDNRNVRDYILTAYASQTTAHQLDVIKEGPVPNVNAYTFNIYKMFPGVGSDYETACAFMMQPAVTEIVKAYNRNKSIYNNTYIDPIRSVTIDIAKKFNPDVEYYGEAKALLDNIVKHYSNVRVLNYDALKKRMLNDNVSEEDKTIEQRQFDAVFDYLVVKQFEQLKNTSDKINAYTQIINPDKYGAKQTIFATSEILDKVEEITSSEDVFLSCKNATGKDCAFLDAIFPGITSAKKDNLNDYLVNSNDADSVIPPLHAFMKYATMPSIVINRRLFKTQDPRFRRIVDHITGKLSGKYKRKSEKLDDSFTNYIISELISGINVLTKPVSYNLSTNLLEETDGNTRQELARIYGLERKPNFFVPKGNSSVEFVEFNPLDKANPTPTDIRRFMKLTPAQKVEWVKRNFEDSKICKYLKVNLNTKTGFNRFNPKGQVIEYIDSFDLDVVRDEFEDTFYNTNPLLKLTAMDIIKYAFVVEGRANTKKAVSQVLTNQPLLDSMDTEGTGIVDSLKDGMEKLLLSVATNDEKTLEKIDDITERYIRANSTMKEISQVRINSIEWNKYFPENHRIGDILSITDNEQTHDFLVNKGIIYEYFEKGEDKPISIGNSYVNITQTIKGKPVQTLYKIVEGKFDGQFLLYPLNKLEPNEHLPNSLSQDNNQYSRPSFYKTIITRWKDSGAIVAFSKYYQEHVSETDLENSKVRKIEVKTSNYRERVLDINSESPATIQLINQISDHFKGGLVDIPLYVVNADLNNILRGRKRLDRPINVDGIEYNIFRIDNKAIAKYLGNENPVEEADAHFSDIIATLRSFNANDTIPVYSVVPVSTRKYATVEETPVEEVILNVHKLQASIASTGDANAKEAVKINFNDGIGNTVQSVNAQLELALNNVRSWIKKEVDTLITGNTGKPGLEMFCLDPVTHKYLTMTDPKVFDAMRDNPDIHRLYLKTYLDIKRLIDRFEAFNYSEYADKDKHLQTYVDEIMKEVNRLKDNPIYKQAEKLYVTEYLAKVSKNPNIQQNIISLLEGYHSTSWLTAAVNDLQDNSNPIVQIITKNVMSEIRAKEMQAVADARDFAKAWEDYEKEAASKGMPVNIDKFIDEYGHRKGFYNERFTKDLNDLYTSIKQTKAEYHTATDENERRNKFEAYLHAKRKFNEFLLQNVNREIEDNYYHELLLNERSMMHPDGRYLEIYVEHEMLTDRKKELHKALDENGPDEAIINEIKEIENKLKDLTTTAFINEFGTVQYKEEAAKNATREQLINSLSQAEKLNTYIENGVKIRRNYFDYKTKDGFEDQLQRNREIIDRWENRDPITNLPTRSETELNSIPEYVKAKSWVRQNTYHKYGLSRAEREKLTSADVNTWLKKYIRGEVTEKDEDFKYVLGAAIKYFEIKKGTKANPKSTYKTIAKLRDARDENGVIDARLFTDDDLQKIRDEELEKLGISEDESFSERGIIKNGTTSRVIYLDKFYRAIKVDGVSNPQYKAIVADINKVLRPHYSGITRRLRTYEISEDGLKTLLDKFEKLGYDLEDQTFNRENAIKSKLGVSKRAGAAAAKFIKDNVTFEVSEENKLEFERQWEIVKATKSEEYQQLWLQVNREYDEDKAEYVPNHLLWGSLEAKEEVKEKWINVNKTAALEILTKAYSTTNSQYYEAKQLEMIKDFGINSEEYKEWYELNHVYNPYTGKFEPLPCWTVSRVNSGIKGEYLPTSNMQASSIKEDKVNPNYVEGSDYAGNYKNPNKRLEELERNKTHLAERTIKTTEDDLHKDCLSDGRYDSNIIPNEYEEKILQHIDKYLNIIAKTPQAKRRFNRNYMPIMAKKHSDTTWYKELAKIVGVVDTNRSAYWDGSVDIDYDSDYTPTMPMASDLMPKDLVTPPVKERYATDEEYLAALEDYNNHKDEIEARNKEIMMNYLNRDWKKVMQEFIVQAGHYNAILDVKPQLYMGIELLRDIKVYDTRPDTHTKLKKKGVAEAGEQQKYKTKVDTNTLDQYLTWINRVVFNHYKQAQGIGEKIGNILQGFTSTSYMTLNLRAGIANVLVGETSMLSEAFAGEYFTKKGLWIGNRIASSSMFDHIHNMYSDKSDTKAGAIIKGIQVVDYSTLNGRIEQLDMKEWSQRVSDIGFSMNNGGEYLMQNGAMFAMMQDHKVIENPNKDVPGEREYIVVNFEEYAYSVREKAFRQIATPEQLEEYETYIKNIKVDANGAKDFAWYRKDPISSFILEHKFTKEQITKFKDAVEALRDEVKKEFDAAPNLYDQLDKSEDGYMTFAKGSIFETLNVKRPNQEITDAYQLLAEFKGRVISVNKKIHGNYGKLDSAKIEKYWIGRLIMQYHKHIPTGILKRYRREGYFNEERGTVEKGIYVSLYDFLAYPIKEIKAKRALSKEETAGLEATQNLFGYIVDYFKYLSVYGSVMPEYEKHNMARLMGSVIGLLVAVGATMLAKMGWDDDDKKDSIAYNLLVYEMDRLCSELEMWTPTGAISEFRKQWSSPIAAGSIISDCYRVMDVTCGLILDGIGVIEDYDPYYRNGRYRGRHKLGVYFERRLPYWRNYTQIRDIAESNHYYKIGNNLISRITGLVDK